MCTELAPGGIHIRAHEPTVWGLSDFVDRLRLSRISDAASSGSSAGAGAGAGGGAGTAAKVGPDRCCSPRHMMPFNSL